MRGGVDMNDLFWGVINNAALIKLCFAALAGLIIGFERELKGKPLGLKTCLVVSVTACLLTIVSFEAAMLYSVPYSRPMDSGRIPSYIISGVGFLGAGVILRRNNDAISGLTTAALVLASAGMGITIGAGFYIEALLGIIFIFLAVQVIPTLVDLIGPKKLQEIEIRARLSIHKNTDLTELIKKMNKKQFRVRRVKIKEENNDIILTCLIVTSRKMYTTDVFYALKELEDIIQVEIENLS